MSRWFRHYAGMCRDEKLVRVALRAKQPIERVVWVYAAILESAAEVNEDGKYDFDIGEASYFLRSDEDDVRRIVDALADMERLCEGAVAKWGDRQFKSDTSADRQRNYRDRKKQANGDNGDAIVTSPSRHGDAPELETDTDTEKKERDAREARLAVSKEFSEQFWPAFPNKVGKPAAERAFYAARKRGCALDRIMAGLDRYMRAKPADRPWLNPATFLNQERFADEPAGLVLVSATPDERNAALAKTGQRYLTEDHRDWCEAADRYKAEHGKYPPRDKNGGWYFPASYFQTAGAAA